MYYISNIYEITRGVKTVKDFTQSVNMGLHYLQGSEAFYILRNAAEKNVINRSRLLRYARRRYVADKLIQDIEEIGLLSGKTVLRQNGLTTCRSDTIIATKT